MLTIGEKDSFHDGLIHSQYKLISLNSSYSTSVKKESKFGLSPKT